MDKLPARYLRPLEQDSVLFCDPSLDEAFGWDLIVSSRNCSVSERGFYF